MHKTIPSRLEYLESFLQRLKEIRAIRSYSASGLQDLSSLTVDLILMT